MSANPSTIGKKDLAATLLQKARAQQRYQPVTGTSRFHPLRPAAEELIKKDWRLTEIITWVASEAPQFAAERNSPQWWQLYHYLRNLRRQVRPDLVRSKPRRPPAA